MSKTVGKSEYYKIVFESDEDTFIIDKIFDTQYTLNSEDISKILDFNDDCISYYVIGYNSNISNDVGYPSKLTYLYKPYYKKIILMKI